MSGLILPFGSSVPIIAADAFIAPTATVIGDVGIGTGSSIWFGTVVRGDVRDIRIGERTNIQDNSVVHVTKGKHSTVIGSDITIGHHATIHGCVLEDHCFIGMGATVMDGVVVESRAMVAAGALLTPGKRVKRGELWAGNPAKPLRMLSEEELATLGHAAVSYHELSRTYMREMVAASMLRTSE